MLRDSIASQILHVKNPSEITTGKHNFQKLTAAQECHITGGGEKMYQRVMRKKIHAIGSMYFQGVLTLSPHVLN